MASGRFRHRHACRRAAVRPAMIIDDMPPLFIIYFFTGACDAPRALPRAQRPPRRLKALAH